MNYTFSSFPRCSDS